MTKETALFRGELAPSMVALLGLVALASFSTTAIPVVLPAISSDLGSLSWVPWVVTAFLGASTVAMLLAGRTFDAVGLRRSFRATTALFTLTSLLCAAAPSTQLLVIGRALQGLAAGFALTVAAAGIGIAVPPLLRARAFAGNAAVWGLLAVVGPLIAAASVPVSGWRGVFVLNALAATLVGLAGWTRLPTGGPRASLRLDFVGAAILAALTVVVTVGVAALGGFAVASVFGALLLLGAYWMHAGRQDAPVFDRRVLVGVPFGAIHLTGMAAFAASGLAAYLPFYVEVTLGGSPTASAVVVGSLPVGWTVAMFVVARLSERRSEGAIAFVGYLLILPSIVLAVVEFSVGLGTPVLVAAMFVLGAGVGAVSSSMLVLLQATANVTVMGQATASHQFARSIGFTVANALVGALVIAATREGALPGDELSLDGLVTPPAGDAGPAIANGLRWAGLLMFVLSVPGAFAAVGLWRREERARAGAGSA